MTHTGMKAIITGAAQGIGLAIARRLAREGAHTAIVDIDGRKAQQAADALVSEGYKADSFAVDIRDVGAAKKMIADVSAMLCGLDILINNAGVLDSGPISALEPDEWERVLDINLRAAFFISQSAVETLKQSTSPRIVNISSLAGRMGGYETGMAYTASKGGLISMTMGMARQLAPHGITVNCVCPGTTESDIIRKWTPEKIDGLKAKIPLGRLGKPEDVAAAVAFLTSGEAGFITGQCLDVNGGMFMG